MIPFFMTKELLQALTQSRQSPRKAKRIQPLTPDRLRERRRHIERVQYVARAQQKLKDDKEAADQLDRDFAERNAQITAGVQMAISRMNAHSPMRPAGT